MIERRETSQRTFHYSGPKIRDGQLKAVRDEGGTLRLWVESWDKIAGTTRRDISHLGKDYAEALLELLGVALTDWREG